MTASLPITVADAPEVFPVSKFVVEEMIDLILEGRTVRSICERPGMPTYQTVLRWRKKYPDFRDAYDAALRASADQLADEELELVRETAAAKLLTAPEVQARKLLSESLKWHARIRNPNRFGEKTQLEVSVANKPADQWTDAELATIVAVAGSSRAGIAAPAEDPA